jgi:hypothetical protein
VAELYRELETHGNFGRAFAWMRELCDHVASSKNGNIVFCATSMHVLMVSQHEELERGDALHIELEGKQFEQASFKLYEQELVSPTLWHCPAEAVIHTFEGFLRKKKWVSENLF